MTHSFRLAAALLTLTALTDSVLAHEGHGLPGTSHWHSTDTVGFLLVAGVAAAMWFGRKK
ncbi:hypothetical protein [Sphaerotilus sp.]|uniref:hypothetical protein n=1 Tax=Sphaerotilus sp. TaxID=2093942 RepID=UPI0034E2F778